MPMPRTTSHVLVTLALAAAACAGSTEPAESPKGDAASTATSDASAEPSAASKAPEPATPTVVTTCEQKDSVCLPPPAFVKKLCANVNPDLALVYFKQGSPFTRGYLTRNTDAWNASGGASSQDKLVFDEEVIVVAVRKNTTGIEVSGASGGYDVIRWDGSCASLSGEELTFKAPPGKAKHAKLEWKSFSDESQAALLTDAAIAKINKERRDECKGVSMGDVSKKCVTAVDKLSESIAAFVKGGGEVPVPKALK